VIWPAKPRAAIAPLALALTLCGVATHTHAWPTFIDVASEAGVDFIHVTGAQGQRMFPESVGGGCVFFDYDRDGLLDLYMVNGGDFRGDGAPNKLYRNRGDGTFEDATEAAGAGDAGFGIGAVAGDYDGDGWEDLYVCNLGADTLYRNTGGAFVDATRLAMAPQTRWSSSAAFFDADGDGDLDLCVATYANYVESRDGCEAHGMRVFCGPETFDAQTDALYRNNGDGTFTDVSADAGFTTAGRGLAVMCADYDDDGDADVFIANDMSQDFLYKNRGDGTFEEAAFLAGMALSEDGTMGNGMGIDIADMDNDGRLDLFITNFQDQVNTLYHNDADGFFTDVSYPSETGAVSLSMLAWGCALADFDNDGLRDIFVANGHIHDNIEVFDDIGTYAQRKLLYRNLGDGTYAEMGGVSGAGMAVPRVSRGAAVGDYDNDGDLDIAVNNIGGRASLLRNDGGSDGAWLRVVLEPPTAAVGARVWVTTDLGVTVMHEGHTGGSYASHSDTRPLFGLGEAATASLRVDWPDGATTRHAVARAGATIALQRADATD
jgi:enediyne biosynthesis protein E4